MKKIILILILTILTTSTPALTIYVDANATGTNDGSSWINAYNFLQDALTDARYNTNINQIHIAQGTYTPDTSTTEPNGTGNRYASFALINNVAIYGGFPTGGADFNDRDPNTYETILSGDLLGNDTQSLEPNELPNDPNRTDNCCNVFYHDFGLNLDSSATLDGFTITAGHADSAGAHHKGGGIYNSDYSNPTITNCTFRYNLATYGGGLSNLLYCDPKITNCSFTSNYAENGGGAFDNHRFSEPTITNCTFTNNHADIGGAIYNNNSLPDINNCNFNSNAADEKGGAICNSSGLSNVSNCTFTDNSAQNGGSIYNIDCNLIISNCLLSANLAENGGAMYNRAWGITPCNPIVTNCIFSGNLAQNNGGAIYNYAHYEDCIPTITNCTFISNSAKFYGGAMYNYADNTYDDCYPIIYNSILWANSASTDGNQIYDDIYSSTTATHSDIQGGWPGLGNIDIDPSFAKSGYWDTNGTPTNADDDFWVEGDYHLQSQAGRWDPNQQQWIIDSNTSRCIDAGNPGSLLVNEPNVPNNLRINMGTYGGTAEASMAPYDWALLCDVDNNGVVDFIDYAHLSSIWTEDDDESFADFNRDSVISILDVALMTNDWLNTTLWH
jgi:predicted outer membrane repeat protein